MIINSEIAISPVESRCRFCDDLKTPYIIGLWKGNLSREEVTNSQFVGLSICPCCLVKLGYTQTEKECEKIRETTE